MKPLPKDFTALVKEFKSFEKNSDAPRARLLRCIMNSWEIKRSINRASILLVGPSGVGKSSTMNHLLKYVKYGNVTRNATQNVTQVAKTNNCQSQTKSSNELIIKCEDPNYDVKDLQLGLIDTPGLCDTASSDQGACNLSSIESFFSTHKELKSLYPNLIFVIVNANDNRMTGENSTIGISLKYVKQLYLVDRDKPNVVAVVTHACSVPGDELERQKSDIKKIICDTLKVNDTPVVLLENCPGDWQLRVDDNGWTCLPNDEKQPRNLYDACANVLQENNDGLGLIIFNSAFPKSINDSQGRIKCGHEVKAKNVRDKFTADEQLKLEFFKSVATGTGSVCDNVSTYMGNQKNMPSKEQRKELMQIGLVLENLNPCSLGYIEYALGSEISATGRNMLQAEFQITTTSRNKDFYKDCLVGQGYNIITDKSATGKVVRFIQPVKYQHGIAIPTRVKFEKVQETSSFMEVFEDDEYTQSRLKSLDISLTEKPKVSITGQKTGYNKLNDSTSSSSTSKLSFLFEQRMFELKINTYKENKNPGQFTKEFKDVVANLPSKFTNMSQFEKFFDRFGHFVVSSAYFGGSVEMKFPRDVIESESMSLEEAKECLAASFKELDIDDADDAAGSTSDEQKAESLLNKSNDFWEGGNREFQKKETLANRKNFRKWKASLISHPTMLTSTMSLEPISTAVSCVDPKKAQATYDALKDRLGGDIIGWKPDECFPSSSVVYVERKDGVVKQKKMMNLEVGDKVMGWDEKRNRAVFTEVIMFAHRASQAMDVEYLKIVLEDGNKITLSSNHLIMVGKHKKAIMAEKVKLGGTLFTIDEHRQISPKQVLAVEKVIEQGVYCPITVHGNLIVDNVLASCYASVQDHVFLEGLVKISAQSIAHFGLMPMRALHKLGLKWLRRIPNDQTIHPYLQWLCKLKLPFMAN